MSTPSQEAEFISPPPILPDEGQVEVPTVFTPGYAAVLDYLLKVEIPEKYKEEFAKFKPVLTQVLALANIRREDIPRYVNYFDIVVGWYKIGQPIVARKRMARMVVELMLTRSVEFGERKLQTTVRREQMLEGFGPEKQEKEKKGFWIFKR